MSSWRKSPGNGVSSSRPIHRNVSNTPTRLSNRPTRSTMRKTTAGTTSKTAATTSNVFLSSVGTDLWSEVERLRAMTDRLQQRLTAARAELAANDAKSNRNLSSRLDTSTTSSLHRRGEARGADASPVLVTFTPGKSRHGQSNPSPFSPRRQRATEGDAEDEMAAHRGEETMVEDSVLTSLGPLQFSPPTTSAEGHLSPSSSNSPFLVELRPPGDTSAVGEADDWTPREGERRVTPKPHSIHQTRALAVEAELRQYVEDLLALERDLLHAQKGGLLDSHSAAVCAVRLGLREELHACQRRAEKVTAFCDTLVEEGSEGATGNETSMSVA